MEPLAIEAIQHVGLYCRDIKRTAEWYREVLRAYFSNPNFWFSAIASGQPPEGNYNVNRLTFQALGEFDLREDFARVDHPVLIVFGEDDPGGRPLAQATVDALSNADVRFVIIEKCGHFWQERSEPFYAHVADFLGLDRPSL